MAMLSEIVSRRLEMVKRADTQTERRGSEKQAEQRRGCIDSWAEALWL